MSLKLSSMPDETTASGPVTPPPQATVEDKTAKGKRHRRSRLEIALEKQAKGKPLTQTDITALEKANEQQQIQSQESETHQDGEGSGSSEQDSTPPWEDPSDYESALDKGAESTSEDTVGHFGPTSLPQEQDTQKLGEVGNFYNIGGVRCQLVHRDYDFLIFKKAHK